MKKVSPQQAGPVIEVVTLIEKIIARRRLDKSFHRDEVEKVFSYLLQGKDTMDAYERRDAGVDDAVWNNSIKTMKEFLNLEKKNGKEASLFT